MPWGIQIYFMAEFQKTIFKAALLTHVIDHGKHHHLLLKIFNVFNDRAQIISLVHIATGAIKYLWSKRKAVLVRAYLHTLYKRSAFNEMTAFPGLKLVHGRIVTNVSFCL